MSIRITAPLLLDSYKASHRVQYSPNTEVVYSTWTPRATRLQGVDYAVTFGIQAFIKDYLIDNFNETFFKQPKDKVIAEIKRVMKNFTGDEDTSHWEALHDLGYLPLSIRALPEGTLCPIRVPMLTIENTKPEFYWLTNFIETIFSTEVWKPMTSATIASHYRDIVEYWSNMTCDNGLHLDFQCHDFSMRGMASQEAALMSGAGHLLSFRGSDTIPATLWIEKYYKTKNVDGNVATSIPATGHSVAETNIIELVEKHSKDANPRLEAEKEYFGRLLDVYPSGLFSYVSDTYNLWEVLTDVLPAFRDDILAREGRVVVRPDSGDPCDIVCGINTKTEFDHHRGIERPVRVLNANDSQYWNEINKGVIELLWETFGGTINSKGYKVLDPHIGCIYGDAISPDRANEICKRLESKGFASSNIVFGVGSWTYNMNTRDSLGFALKTVYGQVSGKELLLYKNPITDDGIKKSQKGRVVVKKDENGKLIYIDNMDKKEWLERVKKGEDELRLVFEDGKLLVDETFEEVRNRLKTEISKRG